MKTLKNKFPKTALALLLIAALISSCSSDDEPFVEPMVELETLVIDCSTSVSAGEELILENRNSGIDYIINCVYVVDGDFIIKPGVTIQFGTDAGVRVYDAGSIQVLGQANNQIVLTGEDTAPGAWRGIFIDSNDIKNKIEHAKIEYAGGNAFNSNGDTGAVIVWSDTRLDMNNTLITNSQSYGFNASYGGDELILENNTITLCTAPMYIEGAYPTAISGGNYTGNATDAIIVANDQITGNHNWSKLNVPYHLPEGLQVIPGGNLSIMPGVIIKFGADTRLYINEGASGPKPSLVAVGTTTNPILFTSLNNAIGDWRGIYFDSPNTLNEIGFTTIEYASNSNQDGAIETWYGTVLNVHDVTFKDIQNCAIQQYISNSSPDTLTTSNLDYVNVGSTICQN